MKLLRVFFVSALPLLCAAQQDQARITPGVAPRTESQSASKQGPLIYHAGPWEQEIVRERRDSLGQARAHLGDEQLERAYAHGMALRLENALDLALPIAGPA